jgi:MYXO-CTERM domain-containing protein
MHGLRLIRDAMIGELLRLADDRRQHRRRMVGATAAAGIGVIACAIASTDEAATRGPWWTTLLIVALALGLAAHELRCVRALDDRIRALGRVLAPLA